MKQYSFDQIAGYGKEKKSLRDVCGLLQSADRLSEMGIRLPGGILLVGEPGVGKTVMAEALIAGSGLACERFDAEACDEDDRPLAAFLSALADRARDKAPCILFFDELDKLLGHVGYRGPSYDMAATRAFLHMIDSLRDSRVTVLAVVNDEDMLSAAIRRSGRFDRTIRIGLPEQRDRYEILRHYAAGKPTAAGIDYDKLARDSAGMSGADIECVMNEAGLLAVSRNRRLIRQSDIEYAMECKRFQGTEHESRLNEVSLRIVAAHEIGHTVVTLALCPEWLSSVTLLPFGESQGHMKLARREDTIPSRSSLEAEIAIMTAGREGEKLFYPYESFAGARDDMMRAYRIAERLVTQEGLYGLEYLTPEPDGPFEASPVSDNKLHACENMIHSVIESAMRRASDILSANRGLMAVLIDRLMTVRELTLTGEEVREIAAAYGLNDGKKAGTA